MRVISPDVFYRYLITNENFSNDLALYPNNQYLDENGNLKNKFNLNIFNLSGDWFENQVNTMNTQKDDNKEYFGNFQYLTTVVDETAMFPQYTELFSLQIMGFEEDREEFINFLDSYATALNNHESELTLDNETYDIFIQLGELSTPTYSDKMDLNGTEMFSAYLSFVVRVTTNIITAKKIKLYHLNPATDVSSEEEIAIPYISLDIKRTNDLLVDNRASNEKFYNINKSDFEINLSIFYTKSTFCEKIMDYVVFPEKADTNFLIHYIDESSTKDNTGTYSREYTYDLVISGVNVTYQFGNPVSIAATFKKNMNSTLGE